MGRAQRAKREREENQEEREAEEGRRGQGRGKGDQQEEEEAPLPSEKYSAAATVANFCGSVNSFIASGFRTEMAFGFCYAGSECRSRIEDKQAAGSGKAKMIPVYSGPDQEDHCAPCWE